MTDPQSDSFIEVGQVKAIEELEEIPVERNTKEDHHCTLVMHTRYRSFLGQINGLQSRTQFQCCYKFTTCASKKQLLQHLVMRNLLTSWRDSFDHNQGLPRDR